MNPLTEDRILEILDKNLIVLANNSNNRLAPSHYISGTGHSSKLIHAAHLSAIREKEMEMQEKIDELSVALEKKTKSSSEWAAKCMEQHQRILQITKEKDREIKELQIGKPSNYIVGRHIDEIHGGRELLTVEAADKKIGELLAENQSLREALEEIAKFHTPTWRTKRIADEVLNQLNSNEKKEKETNAQTIP